MPATTVTAKQGRRHSNPVIDGVALRRARRAKRLTVRSIADECTRNGVPVDQANLCRAERGERGAIGVDKAAAVAQVLDVDVAEILTERGKELMGLKERVPL